MPRVVDRLIRDHVRYTGDGLPGEPVNAPLPIGDPSSGVYHPTKRDIRDAIGDVEGDRLAAEAASAAAVAAAGAAQGAMVDVQGATLFAANVATLLANSATSIPEGTVFATRAEGFSYQVTAGTPDMVTSGGVGLRALPSSAGSVMPEQFGASEGAADNRAALQAAFASGAPVLSTPGKRYRIAEGLTIPAGAKIVGTLRLVTSMLTGSLLTIGDDVTAGEIHLHYDGTVPTAAQSVIGARFTCDHLSVTSDVETAIDCIRLDNTGAKIGRFTSRNWTRPLVIGLGGSSPTVGGVIDSVEIDTFLRGIAVQHAYGWHIRSLVARKRAAGASKQPGHNGLLVSSGSDWIIDTMEVDGSGEHAFRVGGSTYGGESSRWHIGTIVTRNCGGCPVKLNDGYALTRDWSIGSVTAIGSFMADPGRNSELLRLSYVRNGVIGTATARRANGAVYSVSGGLHIGDAQDIHVGVLDVSDYLTEAIAVRDQDAVVAAPVARISVGYLRATGSVSGGLLAFSSNATINGFQIGGGVFDLPSASNLVTSNSGTVFTTPVRVAGYLKSGARSLTGSVAEQVDFDLDTDAGVRVVGRGSAMGGDLGLNAQQFSPDDVVPERFGGFYAMSRGVSPASGAWGTGYSFSRPGSSGRRGAAIVPYQDGSGVNQIGLSILAGSNSVSTNSLRRLWDFRTSGDLDFRDIGVGPVVRSPNGSRWRLVVSDSGAVSAVSA